MQHKLLLPLLLVVASISVHTTRSTDKYVYNEVIDQITCSLMDFVPKFNDQPKEHEYHYYHRQTYRTMRALELAKIIQVYPPASESTQDRVLQAIANLRSEYDRVSLIILLNEHAKLHPSVISSALKLSKNDEEFVRRNIISHTVENQILSDDQITLILHLLPSVINVKENVVNDLIKKHKLNDDHLKMAVEFQKNLIK